MISIKRNIVASYVGQMYTALMGIVLVPLYVKYMGAEAYGLVGFYAVLQSWFMLLDFGITPTISREAARFRGKAVDESHLIGLLRAFECLFFSTATLGAIAIAASSSYIANNWLTVEKLSRSEVQRSVALIAFIVALRWLSELYRGIITGLERLVWLNAFNIAIATLRFAIIIPFLILVSTRPTAFFSYQLAVASIEVLVLILEVSRRLPKTRQRWQFALMWKRVRKVLHFSLGVAVAGVMWIVATQSDKLILSRLLSLSNYAYFTLAVLAANGVMVISIPISAPLLPRMVALNAENKEADLIRVYRNATQFVAVMALPTSAILAVFSRQVLWVWTGNQQVAANLAPVLTLYALGNGLLALSAFPYYLQFAKGDLKLHLIGSALFIAILIPLLVWATLRFGMVGAGYAWLVANAAYFIAWIPMVHHRFAKGLQKPWLFNDLAAIVIATGLSAGLARRAITWPANRTSDAALLAVASLCLLSIAAAASSRVRDSVMGKLRTRTLQGSV